MTLHTTVQSLTLQRDELRRRVAHDRARREQEAREAYRRGYAAGFHAARRQAESAPTLRSVA